jgi:hypothetical protein
MIEVQRLGSLAGPELQKSMIFSVRLLLSVRNFHQAFTIRRRQNTTCDAPDARGIKGAGDWLIDMRVLQYTLCHTHQFLVFCSFCSCALTVVPDSFPLFVVWFFRSWPSMIMLSHLSDVLSRLDRCCLKPGFGVQQVVPWLCSRLSPCCRLSAWSNTPCLGYRGPRCAQTGIMS